MLNRESPGEATAPSQAPAEFIEVGGSWYVHAGSALADDQTSVLKHDETFAIFDRYGDIQPIGLGEQGLYRDGTRHLSQLALKIAGKRPMLLSSTVSEDNVLLTVDLANAEFAGRDDAIVRAETIHVLRTLFLWDGVLHERIDLHNYGDRTTEFALTHHIEADFHDVFEVRGMSRARRGQVRAPVVTPTLLRLAYGGLDERERVTDVRCSATPDPGHASSVSFEVTLEPGASYSVCLSFACAEDPVSPPLPALEYESAFHLARDERRTALDAMCTVRTSNEYFNAWFTRARADLAMLRTASEAGPYPYAGIPWFSTPFGRDGLIGALESLWVDPSLAAGVLRFLAATQATEVNRARDAEPGKILHESRCGEMATLGEVPFERYYGSVDATPLFVLLAGAYYRTTADMPLINAIWPNVERALDWIDRYGDVDGDGFVEYTPNPDALLNQGWKDSVDSVFHADGSLASGPIALAEVQAYVYAAKVAASELALARGLHAVARARSEEAAALRDRFEQAFWREELGTYALALDGAKRPCDVRTSNAGHALFGGIALTAHGLRVADTLAAESTFSGWGLRTLASTEARYNPMSYHNGSVWPHDNAMIAEGLARYGRKADVLRIFDGLFAATRYSALHRLPELFCGFPRRPGAGPTRYPVAASPQTWASGAVFMLLRACLGMTVDAIDGHVTFDTPSLPDDLDWLELRGLRVGHDLVNVDLRRSGSGFALETVNVTGGIQVSVI